MKRWVWLLLIAACLPIPAVSQTTDAQKDPVLVDAYTQFFAKVCRLMEPDEAKRLTGQRDPKHTDHWLAERLFTPGDIVRIEFAVSQWYRDRQVFLNASKSRPKYEAAKEFDRIAVDTATKLEPELYDPKRFHDMIRDCEHQLRLAPEYGYYSACSFPPPAWRRISVPGTGTVRRLSQQEAKNGTSRTSGA